MALYVVATPIGNLEDLTVRALKILKEVEAIIAEDTRTYRKLASTYAIPAKPVYSLYKGNESARVEQLMPKLRAGLNAALVSESGTPAVSDPGALLVRSCLESGVTVVPVPGPSSLTAFLSAAGIYTLPVVFFGFLTGKNSAEDVTRAVASGGTAVFFEQPRRFTRTMKHLAAKLPGQRAVVGRELTKLYEQIWNGRIEDAPAAFDAGSLKGEMVVAVEPARGPDASGKSAEEPMDRARGALLRLREAKIPLSSAVRQISAEHDLPRGRIYREALKLW